MLLLLISTQWSYYMQTGQVSRPVTWRIYSSNECPLKYTLHDSFCCLKSCLLTFPKISYYIFSQAKVLRFFPSGPYSGSSVLSASFCTSAASTAAGSQGWGEESWELRPSFLNLYWPRRRDSANVNTSDDFPEWIVSKYIKFSVQRECAQVPCCLDFSKRTLAVIFCFNWAVVAAPFTPATKIKTLSLRDFETVWQKCQNLIIRTWTFQCVVLELCDLVC